MNMLTSELPLRSHFAKHVVAGGSGRRFVTCVCAKNNQERALMYSDIYSALSNGSTFSYSRSPYGTRPTKQSRTHGQ